MCKKSQLTSIKGHNYAANLQKNHVYVVYINAYIKFGIILSSLFVLSILGRNKILTSTKGHHFVTNWQKIPGNYPNLNLLNMNAYIRFREILSICSKDIVRKRNSDINQEP